MGNLLLFISAIITLIMGYIWYKNPDGNIEPLITIVSAASGADPLD